jgi:hypothetical protein
MLLVCDLILEHDVIGDVHVVRIKVIIHIAILDMIKLVENLAVTLEVIQIQAALKVIQILATFVVIHNLALEVVRNLAALVIVHILALVAIHNLAALEVIRNLALVVNRLVAIHIHNLEVNHSLLEVIRNFVEVNSNFVVIVDYNLIDRKVKHSLKVGLRMLVVARILFNYAIHRIKDIQDY